MFVASSYSPFPELGNTIKKLRAVFATADDHVNVEKKIDQIFEELNKKPNRDDFPALLEKTFEFATLKAEHDRIKRLLHEKLGLEV